MDKVLVVTRVFLDEWDDTPEIAYAEVDEDLAWKWVRDIETAQEMANRNSDFLRYELWDGAWRYPSIAFVDLEEKAMADEEAGLWRTAFDAWKGGRPALLSYEKGKAISEIEGVRVDMQKLVVENDGVLGQVAVKHRDGYLSGMQVSKRSLAAILLAVSKNEMAWEAFRFAVKENPEVALDFLTGDLRLDDETVVQASLEVPEEYLRPLLEHEDKTIRAKAFMALGQAVGSEKVEKKGRGRGRS